MKTIRFLLFFTVLCISQIVNAQSPPSFKYQAVLRDSQDQVLINKTVSLKFDLLQDSPNGIVSYSETHAITTNSFGLIYLEVGTGTTTDSFSSLLWGEHDYFLQTSLDRGNGYAVLGVSQLVSVPYALHASTATFVDDADADSTNEIQSLQLINDTIYLSSGGQVSLSPYSDIIQQNTQNILTHDTLFIHQNTLIQSNQVLMNQLLNASINTQSLINTHLNNDQDTSISNEIQILSLSNDTLYLSNGGFVSLRHLNDTSSIQSLIAKSQTDSTLFQNLVDQNQIDISNLNSKQINDSNLLHSFIQSNSTDISTLQSSISTHTINDQDTSDINEIQALSISSDTLYLSNGGHVYLGHLNDTNIINSLSSKNQSDSLHFQNLIDQQQTNFTILDSKQTSDSSLLHNTITNVSSQVSILQTNLNTHVNTDSDTSTTNELQTISFTNDSLYLSSGNQIDLSSLKDGTGTDDQTLQLNGNLLSIENGNSINLVNLNTDQQQLSTSSHQLTISNGNTITIDTEPANELQVLNISNDTLFLTSNSFTGANHFAVLPSGFDGNFSSLSGIPNGLSDGDDNTQLTESQVDSYVSNNGYITSEIDGSTTNEIQTISKVGSQIILSHGGGYITDEVNDGDYNVGNEIQSISISGNQLTLNKGGGTVSLPTYTSNDNSPTNELELPNNPFYGDMVYWNGQAWVGVSHQSWYDGAVLTLVNGNPTWVGGTPPPPTGAANIGDYRDGGIVFWVDPNDPTHGLVVMSYDLGLFEWGCEGTFLGVTDTVIGSGAQNTLNIIANCSDTGTAASICNNLTLNGFSDWFLPSKNEALQIFNNRLVINSSAISNGGTVLHEVVSGSSTFDYWTSSEKDLYISYPDVRLNGAGAGMKGSSLRVRAIRAF